MTMLLFIPPPLRIVMKIIVIRKELSMRVMNESARTVSFEQAYILFRFTLNLLQSDIDRKHCQPLLYVW
jgi:hypothetical protein